jgi:hypothetical protein
LRSCSARPGGGVAEQVGVRVRGGARLKRGWEKRLAVPHSSFTPVRSWCSAASRPSRRGCGTTRRRCRSLGGDVAIVEAVEGRPQLRDELERDLHLLRAAAIGSSSGAEGATGGRACRRRRCRSVPVERVPVADGEAQVLGHGLAGTTRSASYHRKASGSSDVRPFVADVIDPRSRYSRFVVRKHEPLLHHCLARTGHPGTAL